MFIHILPVLTVFSFKQVVNILLELFYWLDLATSRPVYLLLRISLENGIYFHYQP